MKPPPFEYVRPETVEEAVRLLAEHGDDAKVLAGGQSLVPLLNLRLARPSVLVDVNSLDEIAYVEDGDEGTLQIGALVRHADLERSGVVRHRLPVLAEAVRWIGHAAIRNRGTAGGSVVHADPSSELPGIVTLLDATLRLRSARGERRLSAEQFFVGPWATRVEPDEMLVEITFPSVPPATGWAFREVTRRRGDFAVIGVAALLALDGGGTVAYARLAAIGAGPTPVRLVAAERALVGQRADASRFGAAAAGAIEALEPCSDVHASAAYRRHLAGVLIRECLETALERARATDERPAPRRAGTRARAGGASPRTRGARPPRGGDGLVRVTVNGTEHERRVEPRRLLVDFLREDLRLTGTHIGCEHGVCGACTVLMDGKPVRSCLALAVQADGAVLETVEGLAPGLELHPLQAAFRAHHALQCGFCTPGVLMSMKAFLEETAAPTDDQIREALAGNLCRCTGYQNIVEAVRAAAALVDGRGGGGGEPGAG